MYYILCSMYYVVYARINIETCKNRPANRQQNNNNNNNNNNNVMYVCMYMYVCTIFALG